MLDLGCGDGTTALPAARRGADVLGVDIASNLVERATNERRLSFMRDTCWFNFPGPPAEFVAVFRAYYGPTMNAFEAAEANGRATDLQDELEALFNDQNTSASESSTSIPATFLRVSVTV